MLISGIEEKRAVFWAAKFLLRVYLTIESDNREMDYVILHYIDRISMLYKVDGSLRCVIFRWFPTDEQDRSSILEDSKLDRP